MERWPTVVLVGMFLFIVLFVALLIVRMASATGSMPIRRPWQGLCLTLSLIGTGVLVLMTRARELGNWWWGVVAVWCVLAGGVGFWNLVLKGAWRRRGRRA
jgi:hypothetical protein